MSIALTEELLGFSINSSDGGENKGGGSSFGSGFGKSSGALGHWGGDSWGGGSLMVSLVKAEVLKELGPRRLKHDVTNSGRYRRESVAAFATSFRDVMHECSPPPGDRGLVSTPEGGDGGSVTAAGDNKASTADHRHISSDTEGWEQVNKIMLGKAVQSIPAYIERSSLIVALVPLCKHADREDEICDQSSWRGRGWCRVEYMGAALVRSDVSVMIVKGALATPAFVWPVDGLQLPPGHGTYTCCSRKLNAFGTQPFMLHP